MGDAIRFKNQNAVPGKNSLTRRIVGLELFMAWI
jgi:hypothetical protein